MSEFKKAEIAWATSVSAILAAWKTDKCKFQIELETVYMITQ